MIDTFRSPLRFPGSKSKVLKKFEPYFSLPHVEYREPFLGGGSIFFGKPLAKINWINDKDNNIYIFFKVVKDYPNDLCRLVNQTTPNIELWIDLRNSKPKSELDQAFRLLFFNRTNYSGILFANPIGGIKQESKWKIDCRWNPTLISKRILDCSRKLQNVKLTCLDFEEVITAPGQDVLIILDPPYYQKGHSLYPVSMTHEEHVKLADLLSKTKHTFLLTIDNCEEVKQIYCRENFYTTKESWNYSINRELTIKIGNELFISNVNINNSIKN